jgi:hypothetical protein
MPADPAAPTTETVGLLFVHGIGEQDRWEHLRQSVVELAELLRLFSGTSAGISVIDRTEDWQGAPGEPSLNGPAPISVRWRQSPEAGGRAIDFECHEVWWADLGIRTGLFDSIRFWVWGLGQWAAPVYIDLDASRLEKPGTPAPDPAETDPPARPRPQVDMPQSVARQLGYQFLARFNLAWAGLVAVLTVLSLSLFKRVAGSLGKVDTAPSLLVHYLGDVQVYEQRARPGEGLVSDPGHPKRVGIRRRMVSEMVAMGARDYDRWYIMAHSLGTVVAFNGIGEIGHTLPNYLPESLWRALPERLRRDPESGLREDTHRMMPARPAWLAHEDCINRPALFANMLGFITYGSPLDKFAALWPRIVAFERYAGKQPVFSECEWVNIVADTDPVAGAIDRYGAATGAEAGRNLPRLHNIKRPGQQLIGLSHVQYWKVPERWQQGSAAYYRKVLGWLIGRNPAPAPVPETPPFGQPYTPGPADYAVLLTQALGLTLLLWFASTAIIALAQLPFGLADWRPSGANASGWATLWALLWFCLKLMPLVAAAASVVIYATGHLRWLRETSLNRRFALYDAEKGANMSAFIRLAQWQLAGAWLSLLSGVAVVAGIGLWLKVSGGSWALAGLVYAPVMFVLILLAAWLQSLINCRFGSRRDD